MTRGDVLILLFGLCVGSAVTLLSMALYYRVIDWFALAWLPMIVGVSVLLVMEVPDGRS